MYLYVLNLNVELHRGKMTMNLQTFETIIACAWLLLTWSIKSTNSCPDDSKGLGRAAGQQRIIGGVTVTKNSRPYQLLLMTSRKNSTSKSKTMCGAVLIAKDFALTAAHCTYRKYLKKYQLMLSSGKHELFQEEISQQDRNVEQVFTHRQFKSNINSESNDISLLQFSPFNLDYSTRPIQLPDSNFNIDLSKKPKGVVTGWGCTYEGCNGNVSPVLQEVDVPILSNNECKKAYSGIKDSMICAAEADGGKDSCQGDSGGPMVLEEGTDKILIGLVSWGKGCACKGQPGVYTRITSFRNWIQDGIDGKLEPDSKFFPDNTDKTDTIPDDKDNTSSIFPPDMWAMAEAYVIICILAVLF